MKVEVAVLGSPSLKRKKKKKKKERKKRSPYDLCGRKATLNLETPAEVDSNPAGSVRPSAYHCSITSLSLGQTRSRLIARDWQLRSAALLSDQPQRRAAKELHRSSHQQNK